MVQEQELDAAVHTSDHILEIPRRNVPLHTVFCEAVLQRRARDTLNWLV